MQFLISSALASLLFDPAKPKKQWKKQSVSRLFYLFVHMHLISSDSFSFLIFSLLLFSSMTLPTSAFSSVPIVGSLTCKLPSMHVYKCRYNLFYFVFYLYIYMCVCITCACICLCGHHSPHICVCDTFLHVYYYIHRLCILFEGSLEVKLPTIWTAEKQR